MADQQAGWYHDPLGNTSKLRYWDGTQWTNDYADAQQEVQPEAQQTQQQVPLEVQPAEPVVQSVQAVPAAEVAPPVAAASQPQEYPPPAQVQPQAFPPPAQAPQAQVPMPAPMPPSGQYQQQQPPLYAPAQGYVAKKSRAPLIIGIVVAIVLIVAVVVGVSFIMGSGSQASNDPVISVPPASTNPDDATSITGDVTGEVGRLYSTKWFTFTVESMKTATTYGDYTAASGNTLLIAHITLTNTSGSDQPFGTFDWVVDDSSLGDYIIPLDPFTSKMMPAEFTLYDGETASYDVVIEYPTNLARPYLLYNEVNDLGTVSATFKIAIS